jgi:DNA-binding response OmpR family regulator
LIANSTHRILIVDDEHAVADTLALVFKAMGYDAKVAYDAETALVLLQSFPADVAVCDVMLPGMNGIDLAAIVKTTYPNCRVLLISGHPSTADIIRDAQDRGQVFELMAKPFHPTELLARVSTSRSPN